MRISIVVPTRGRAAMLDRCLGALARQDVPEPFEIVVVDDGIGQHVLPRTLTGPTVRYERALGRGPAVARNIGIQAARGEIILFTDDDTVPERSWVRQAVAHLDAHPDHVGVEGPTRSAPFDPLYQHSVCSDGGHALLTCNIAYRRNVLDRLGGFCEGFPFPHCEDLDLGFRALQLGEISTCPEMVVVHPPRPAGAGYLIRRGRLVASELQLMARHPDRYCDGGSYAHAAFIARSWTGRWLRMASLERPRLMRSPRRAARFALLATAQLFVAALTVGATLSRPHLRAFRRVPVLRGGP